MSEEPKTFTDITLPPADYKQEEPVTVDSTVSTELQREIGDEMSRVGFDNLKKLCLQNEYEIAGVKYIGQKLNPKKIKELREIDKQFDDAAKALTDEVTIEEQELARLSAKAFIHLGMTPEQFEETDIPLLQAIITARDMRKRGWFRL